MEKSEKESPANHHSQRGAENVDNSDHVLPGSGDVNEDPPRQRAFMQGLVERLVEDLKKAKDCLKPLKKLHKLKPTEETGKRVEEHEKRIEGLKEELKNAEAHLRRLAPVEIIDEEQPWFERVYANCNGYLVKDIAGDYKFTNETNTARKLREWGISDRRDTETTSPLDRVLNLLHDRYHVDHYGPVAGYKPGLVKFGGKQTLITKGPELMTPAKGEFPTIREYIDGMLQDQAIYAHGWNHLAVVPLYRGIVNTGQILVLAGPVDSGKSVFQNLIVTPLLGGRVAKPYSHMIGRTDFNEDLFESEHLKCDDETPARDLETRLLFASELKKLAADENHWCHGKGKKALTLPPFWRVTVSVNDHPDYLPSIPVNDETLKDKLIILKTLPEATVKLVGRIGGKEAFAEKIREELPAYLYWLLYEFQIPEELRETRFGLQAYQNPEIVEAVEELTPQMLLLNYMEEIWAGERLDNKTVTQIASDLNFWTPPKGIVPQHINTLAKYLTGLTKVTKKVSKEKSMKGALYTLDFTEAGPPRKKGSDFSRDDEKRLGKLSSEDIEAVLQARARKTAAEARAQKATAEAAERAADRKAKAADKAWTDLTEFRA
jgi:hypothetical protein